MMIHPCNSSALYNLSVAWPAPWSIDFLSMSSSSSLRSNAIVISNVYILYWSKSFTIIAPFPPNHLRMTSSMIYWRTYFNFNQRNVSRCNYRSNILSSRWIQSEARLRILILSLALASLVCRRHRYEWTISFICVQNWTSNIVDGFQHWKNGVSWNWSYRRRISRAWI